jgi:hypothetical protein
MDGKAYRRYLVVFATWHMEKKRMDEGRRRDDFPVWTTNPFEPDSSFIQPIYARVLASARVAD